MDTTLHDFGNHKIFFRKCHWRRICKIRLSTLSIRRSANSFYLAFRLMDFWLTKMILHYKITKWIENWKHNQLLKVVPHIIEFSTQTHTEHSVFRYERPRSQRWWKSFTSNMFYSHYHYTSFLSNINVNVVRKQQTDIKWIIKVIR